VNSWISSFEERFLGLYMLIGTNLMEGFGIGSYVNVRVCTLSHCLSVIAADATLCVALTSQRVRGLP
jgi:hypothetical protein